MTLNEILSLIESRRRQILGNPSDPSWSEHFDELAKTIQRMWKPSVIVCPKCGSDITHDQVFDGGKLVCEHCATDYRLVLVPPDDWHVFKCQRCNRTWKRRDGLTKMTPELGLYTGLETTIPIGPESRCPFCSHNQTERL